MEDMNDTIVKMILDVEANYTNNESMKVKKLLNSIEKIDNKCGDLLYWQIILMFKHTPSAIVFLDKNTIAYKKIRTLSRNEHLHWYKYDASDAVNKIAQLFYDALLQRFIKEYKQFNINNSSDVYIPFYQFHELLGIVEENIVSFEKIMQAEELKISFVENLLEFLSAFDSYNPAGINTNSSTWTVNQQESFNEAASARISEFCRKLKYLKFKKDTFKLNFDFTKENISLDNSYLKFILKVIDLIVTACHCTREKRAAKKLFERYSKGGRERAPEASSDALITDDDLQTAIDKLLDEDLIDLLSEIRINKEKLSKLYVSKEKYEMFILLRVDSYIDPFLKYIKKKDGKLEEENVKRMYDVFMKINTIIVSKINELEKRNKENYETEFNVIENEVERYIKENNINAK